MNYQGVFEHLPKHAQGIYLAAYNNAWEQYKEPEGRKGNATKEETAHKVAWAAVKKEYERNPNGGWSRNMKTSMMRISDTWTRINVLYSPVPLF